MLTIGSLFSGIGGLELGLERAGLGPVKWQVEIDDYCQKVLEKHWPGVRRYSDIFSVDGTELESVELIYGGFPCQPFSCAGSRKGDSDERFLWPEFLRIIREVKPRWVVGENVPGLLTIDSGRQFGKILYDLSALGYDAEWYMLNATDFGIPQERKRLFIITHPARNGSPTIFHKDSLDVKSNHARLDGSSATTTDTNDQNNRTRAMPVLGNAVWPEIPNRERSGTNDGVPNRVDRLKCLGNAVVPQVAEAVGRMIMQSVSFDAETKDIGGRR